jgi:hypothetical protein
MATISLTTASLFLDYHLVSEASEASGERKTVPRRRLRSLVQVVWIGVVVAFVARFLWTHWQSFADVRITISLDWILAVFLLEMFRRFLGALRWSTIITSGRSTTWADYRRHLQIFFLSNLAAYIPGTMWYMAVRVKMHADDGQSAVKTSAGLFYEMVLLLWSGAVVGAWGAAEFLQLPQGVAWIVTAGLAAASVLLVHPRILRFTSQALQRFLRRPRTELSVTYGWGLRVLVLSLSVWLISGVSLWCLLRGLQPHPASLSMPFLISLFAFAWVAGFLAPWAPSGLGIRDGILLWGLSTHVPVPVAFVAAVGSRVIIAAQDVVWAGLASIFGTRRTATDYGASEITSAEGRAHGENEHDLS